MRFLNIKNATVEICGACFTDCQGCYMKYVAAKSKTVPFNELAEVIDWLKKWTNCRSISLVGGEPLLHPDLPKIIKYCRSKGFRVTLITSLKVGESAVGKRNRSFVTREFVNGKIDLDVSFQAGKNEMDYEDFVRFLERNASGKKQIFSNIVVDNPEEYL